MVSRYGTVDGLKPREPLFQEVSHESIAGLWEGIAQPTAWLLVFWSALGPGALAAFLQTQVSSSYGLTPLTARTLNA